MAAWQKERPAGRSFCLRRSVVVLAFGLSPVAPVIVVSFVVTTVIVAVLTTAVRVAVLALVAVPVAPRGGDHLLEDADLAALRFDLLLAELDQLAMDRLL